MTCLLAIEYRGQNLTVISVFVQISFNNRTFHPHVM